jgi:chemotaxis protein MotB
MASYMDMVTVLMCLFIVLYALSTVDQDKYVQLKNSLATGFGQVQTQTVDTAEGVVVPPELIDPNGEGFPNGASADDATTPAQQAAAEVANLEALEAQMQGALAAAGLGGLVEYTIDERGLTVRLVGSETFFDGNSAVLRGDSQAVLDILAPTLNAVPNELSIEGNTNNWGNPAPYATDWELSVARATVVLRYLNEHHGVDAKRLSAVGYGHQRPVSEDYTGDAGRLNRRVDIVVHSAATEAVRDLIPGIVSGETQATDGQTTATDGDGTTTDASTATSSDAHGSSEESTSDSHGSTDAADEHAGSGSGH